MNPIGMILGLLVAGCWAITDTSAALAARRTGSLQSTIIAQVGGISILFLIAWNTETFPQARLSEIQALQWILIGFSLGSLSALTSVAMYQSLEREPLALASPLMSANGVVTIGLALVILGQTLSPIIIGTILLTFLGIILISTNLHDLVRLFREKATPHVKHGIKNAIIAMVGFGLLNFALADLTSLWMWIAIRTVSLLCLLGVAFIRHPQTPNQEKSLAVGWGMAIFSGIAESIGLSLFHFATQSAALSLVATFASLYSVGPALVGFLFFRERLVLNQAIGLLLVLVGVGSLA